VLERVVLGPLVARLAAGFASLPLAPDAGQVAIVLPALLALSPGATALVARRVLREPSSRGCGRSDAPRLAACSPRCSPRLRTRAGRAAAGLDARATLVDRDGDGALERGPGEPLRDRASSAAAAGASPRSPRSRRSPTPTSRRGVARRGAVPRPPRRRVQPDLPPQEALTAQVLDASVRSLNRLRRRPWWSAGDLADNARPTSSTRRARCSTAGACGRTRARRLHGVQEADNPDPFYYRPDNDPPRHPGLLDAAQRPFTAHGLDAPWYPVLGNHDLLAQGEVPPTPADRGARHRRPARSSRSTRACGRAPARTRRRRSPRCWPAACPAARARSRRSRRAACSAPPRCCGGSAAAGATAGRLDYTFDSARRCAGSCSTSSTARAERAASSRRRSSRGCARAAQRRRRYVVVFSPQPLEQLRRRRGRAARARRRAERRRRDRRAPPLQRDRPAAPGPYWLIETASLADYPAAVALFRLVARPAGSRSRPGWSTRTARGLAGVSRAARLPRRPGRAAPGLRRAPQDRNAA
jgi:hypothetical protein